LESVAMFCIDEFPSAVLGSASQHSVLLAKVSKNSGPNLRRSFFRREI
jgi:hypothetical protein